MKDIADHHLTNKAQTLVLLSIKLCFFIYIISAFVQLQFLREALYVKVPLIELKNEPGTE